MLKLARGIPMPVDAVTKTFGFMGIRESGKTYAGTKLAEEMLRAKAPIVVLDPVGKWWGLRLGKDGKSKGFDIPVIGGLHGDLPLQPNAGELIAHTLIETGSSAILDVSQLRKNKRKKFITEFCESIFYLRSKDPAAMHVFFEEAHVFAPQRESGQEAMLGAVEDIIRLGRNHGLGATLIDQRPQSVNKNVLNQIECLCVMRLNGKHERNAIMDWVREKGADVRDMADSLPSLETGECMLWSPSWLRILKKTKILAKKTFDASATPKVGKRISTKKLKGLDLGALEEAMSSMVEEAERNDPKKLQRRVAQLEGELMKAQRPVVDDSRTEELEQQVEALRGQVNQLQVQLAEAESMRVKVQSELESAAHHVETAASLSCREVNTRLPEIASPPRPRKKKLPSKRPTNSPHLPTKQQHIADYQQKIINAIAWWNVVGVASPKRVQICFVAGLKNNGHFRNNVSKLKTSGLIVYPAEGCCQLTHEGVAAAEGPDAVPTNDELQSLVRAQLSEYQAKLFDILIDHYPREVLRSNLAFEAGVEQNGHFRNNVSKLKTAEIIEYPLKGVVKASELLFSAQ